MKIRFISLVVLVFSICGCSSLLHRSDPNAPRNTGISRGPYPGVRYDVDEFSNSHTDNMAAFIMDPLANLIALIDLPASAAVDTLYLPFDAAYSLKKPKEEPPPAIPKN